MWCLACSDIEPTNELDRLLAQKEANDGVPFALECLSPQTNFIQELFECHPDLYRRLYREVAPPLTANERERRIARFGRFLEDATRRGRTKLLPPGVGPSREPDAHGGAGRSRGGQSLPSRSRDSQQLGANRAPLGHRSTECDFADHRSDHINGSRSRRSVAGGRRR